MMKTKVKLKKVVRRCKVEKKKKREGASKQI